MLVNPREPVHLTPDGSPNTYTLRVPLVMDRPKYRHALRVAGAVRWGTLDFIGDGKKALAAGAIDFADEAEKDATLAALEGWQERLNAAIDAFNGGRNDETTAELNEAVKEPAELATFFWNLERGWKPYRDKLADLQVVTEIEAIVAARMFVTGWEGENLPAFAKDREGVKEDLLFHIGARDLIAIKSRVDELLTPSEAVRKNSESAAGGSADPQPSATAESLPESDRPKKAKAGG